MIQKKLTVLDLLQGPLQAIDRRTLAVPLACDPLVCLSLCAELFLKLGHTFAQVLSQGSFFHSQHFPILHGLLGIFKLVPSEGFPADQFVSFLDPIGLREVRSASQRGHFVCLLLGLRFELGYGSFQFLLRLLCGAILFLKLLDL